MRILRATALLSVLLQAGFLANKLADISFSTPGLQTNLWYYSPDTICFKGEVTGSSYWVTDGTVYCYPAQPQRTNKWTTKLDDKYARL